VKLESCPYEIIGLDERQIIEAAEMAEKGILPMAGGLLDQAQIAVDAIRFVWHEHAICKSLMMEQAHANVG